ncbi:MAG: tetratricopeptide (TPR) repeat protein [Crocinitomicaceae bacterium]|jgi:tetratricopeptide (TPR) repeat protein
MKIVKLIFLLSLLPQLGFAQTSKLTTATLDFQEGRIEKALTKIDAVVLHQDTKTSAKAWKLRGDIYRKILSGTEVKTKLQPEDLYKQIGDSYQKALSLDKTASSIKAAKSGLRVSGNMALNKGVVHFNAKEYSDAKSMFLIAIEHGEIGGRTDTLAIYNIALVCERMKDYSAAITYYKKSISLNYKEDIMYGFLAFAYGELGDTENYGKTLDEGLSKYPKSSSMNTALLNMKLADGDFEGALFAMDNLIELDPNNAIYYFSKGTILDNIKDIDRAIKAYQKSIDLDPSYFDPQFNLGALYFNEAVKLNNDGGNLSLDDGVAGDKLMKEADILFFKAKGCLEKANSLKPGDVMTLESLKQCYLRSNDVEGYDRVTEKLKSFEH